MFPNKEPVTIDKTFIIIPIFSPQYYYITYNNKGGNTKILSYCNDKNDTNLE